MQKKSLPSLRTLQVFASFGHTESVSKTAQELDVTPGAVSQQLKLLETQVGRALFLRRGRTLSLRPEAKLYHKMLLDGIEALNCAQSFIEDYESSAQLRISALPSLLSKWLYPALGRFQDRHPGVPISMDATNSEPERPLPARMFRLTYGDLSDAYTHKEALFTDVVFPVCAPSLAAANPDFLTPEGLRRAPLLHVDWGAEFASVPNWDDWFRAQGTTIDPDVGSTRMALSSQAVEAAIDGRGVALVQTSFAHRDLQLRRLVRLSDTTLDLPHPYCLCWDEAGDADPLMQAFLDWVRNEAHRLAGQIRNLPPPPYSP
ncbi:MAG: LysR substrate-binding domain-containing protein [Marinibacterium sp.]|nr:LysR substrate-binding domain-containing protein [Marinibacterium sp.]